MVHYTRALVARKGEILDDKKLLYALQNHKTKRTSALVTEANKNEKEKESVILRFNPEAPSEEPLEIATIRWDVESGEGKKRDLIKLGNSSEWVDREDFWGKDHKKRVDWFKDVEGVRYFWSWRAGNYKILTKGSEFGTTLATITPEINGFKAEGIMRLTKEAEELGDLVFVTHLAGEQKEALSKGTFTWTLAEIGPLALQAVGALLS